MLQTAPAGIKLPEHGIYTIDTETETYTVYCDARLVIVHDMAGQAAGRVGTPDVIAYDVVDCQVGQPLTFDGGRVEGTTVLGISLAAVL